jgi:predicted nucleic acid-binding protein
MRLVLDTNILIAALKRNDGIWSHDRAFAGLPGIKVWTTADLVAYVRRS